jgi:hypothetical protein
LKDALIRTADDRATVESPEVVTHFKRPNNSEMAIDEKLLTESWMMRITLKKSRLERNESPHLRNLEPQPPNKTRNRIITGQPKEMIL